MGKFFLGLPKLAVLGLALGTAFLGLAPAFAQAPPAVPSLPDTERRTSYSLTAQTGPFSVGFAIYGDSTDYQDWLTVSLCTSATLNPCSVLTGVTDWTLSSATGSLATIPRPITDATITLTTARTGTLQITGARRPRRTSQFAENRGVAARDLNQVITDLVAQNRENWDLQNRQVKGQPGEVISALQPASTRAGGFLCWDSTGLLPLTCAAGSSGTANVVGPNVSVVGHIATYGNTSGTLLLDGGLVGAGDVVGPASSGANHVPTFTNSGGKILKDSGLTITPSTGTITVTNAKTLAVDNSLDLAGTDGTVITFQGTDTYVGRATTDTLTNKTLTSPTINTATINSPVVSAISGGSITIADINFGVVDNSDNTKAFQFDAANITAGTTRTFGVPNANTTLVGTDATQTLTNKTITAPTITGSTITTSTYNGLTITATTGGVLAIANNKTATVNNTLTLAGTDGAAVTFQGTDTYIGRATTDTLTNKTLTGAVINGGTVAALTNLGIRSTGTGAFDLVLSNTENLTAQRALTLTLNNAPRTISLSGNITTAADFITSGGNAITLTTTGSTGVTLPTSGTLATINTAQTFSGQNIFSALQQFTDIKFSSGKLYPTSDSTTALQVTKADGTTRIMDFDTTNARVGINKTPGAFDLDVNGAANVGGILSILTAAPGTNTTQAASTAFVQAAIVSSTTGVASLNGLTGAPSIIPGTGIAVSAGGSSITVSLTSTSDKTILSNISGGAAAPSANNAATVGASTVLLQCQAASSSASITFNSTVITSTYNNYILTIDSMLPATNTTSLLLTVSDDNGASYKATAYQWARQIVYAGSATPSVAVNAADTSIHILDGIADNNVGRPTSGEVRFFAPSSAASRLVSFKGSIWGLSSNLGGTFSFDHDFSGLYTNALAGALNNIKLAMSSGNINSGNFCLYAVRNS